MASFYTSVSDLVPDASITDQKQSGRCWVFAGLNVLRASMIKELELDSLELSQSFPFFYDKLEKANAFLTRVIAEADRTLDDREVVASLGSAGRIPHRRTRRRIPHPGCCQPFLPGPSTRHRHRRTKNLS